jgi:hypothetical protein
MIKNVLNLFTFTTTVIPNESKFIEKFVMQGDDLSVKMKGSETLYHYKVDKLTKRIIKLTSKDLSAGVVYNSCIKGRSTGKTLQKQS